MPFPRGVTDDERTSRPPSPQKKNAGSGDNMNGDRTSQSGSEAAQAQRRSCLLHRLAEATGNWDSAIDRA